MKLTVFLLMILFSLDSRAQKVIKKTINYETAKKYCEGPGSSKKKFYNQVCPPYFKEKQNQEIKAIDPLIGDLSKTPKLKNKLGVMAGYQLLGFSKGLDLEAEYRFNNYSVGLFFQEHDISSIERYNVITGSAYGVSFHYYFTSLYEEVKYNKMSLSALVNLGISNFETQYEQLPKYMFIGLGLDTFYPLTKNQTVGLYGKGTVDHIYESSIGFLHLGGSFTLGIKINY